MSAKPPYWRYWRISMGLRVAAVLLLAGGAAAHGLGAPVSVLFIGLGLMAVCLIAAFLLVGVFTTKARQDNYGVRVRTGDPGLDQPLNADVARKVREAGAPAPGGWKRTSLFILAIVLFWPAAIAIVIVASSGHRTPLEWGAAVLLPLLCIGAGADALHLKLAADRGARY